jgi:hypothetical protein
VEGEIRLGVSSTRRGGLPLYSAHHIEAVFEWAASQNRMVEWIEAFFIGDAQTQPSMEHSTERDRYARYEDFRAQSLLLAARLIVEANRMGKEPMVEIGISN